MTSKMDVKIGFAPTRRNICSREEALRYRKETLDKIGQYGYQIKDIKEINEEGLLLTDDDLFKAIKIFKEADVDCIFSPHVNFGTESVIARLGKEIGKPFLLWGPREDLPNKDWSNLRYTQVGLFASSRILQRMGVPFTYIVNSTLEDPVFERGFKNFVQASNVVKNFKKIRIGQIGVRPADFWTVICNEGQLLEKFNIQIVPFNLEDIVAQAMQFLTTSKSFIHDSIGSLKKVIKLDIEEEALAKIIALKEVLKNISNEQYISAFALQCWTSLQNLLGVMPCFANSLLYDEGIPVACETDINGAVSAIIAKHANPESSAFFADITSRHPEKEDVDLLWHCGPFPMSLKKQGSEGSITCNSLLDGNPPGIANFEIKGGDLSIIRFDEKEGRYHLFAGQAVGDTGPAYKGTYLWIKVKDWKNWERKLVYGPYIHHVAAVHGKVSPVLYEASRYMDGVIFDPIEPDKDEITDWIDCK